MSTKRFSAIGAQVSPLDFRVLSLHVQPEAPLPLESFLTSLVLAYKTTHVGVTQEVALQVTVLVESRLAHVTHMTSEKKCMHSTCYLLECT